MNDALEPLSGLPRPLDDKTLTEQRPLVRGQLVGYLSGLWQYSSKELEMGKDKIRWAELQLRIIKQLAELYKLGIPERSESQPDDPGEEQERVRRLVEAQLDDLAQAG
jgi:hypothetical protein